VPVLYTSRIGLWGVSGLPFTFTFTALAGRTFGLDVGGCTHARPLLSFTRWCRSGRGAYSERHVVGTR
jgi:hypothetical protein